MGLCQGDPRQGQRPAQGLEEKLTPAPEDAGKRLDVFLAEKIPNLSRSQAKKLISEGQVKVGGRPLTKPKHRLKPGEEVQVFIPAPEPLSLEPDTGVPFEILYEDEGLAVINKPAGVVVHPAAGHLHGTLVHGLLARLKDLSGVGGMLRPGIVHRLDKDTSGLLLIAKDDRTHQALSAMFKERKVKKLYLALVHGVPQALSGKIEAPLGRHPVNRKKMAVLAGGREAVTLWRRKEVFRRAALLEVEPLTGRTHQIRVHLASLGHPIVGDELYGGAKPHGPKAHRQLLHAWKLRLRHPLTGEELAFEAELPEDFREVLDELRRKTR